MTDAVPSRILVLGAAGLIGESIADELLHRNFPVVAAARRFTPAQRGRFGIHARELPIARLDTAALTRLLRECDVVVNCVGVLQDAPADSTQDIHAKFVERLLAALRALGRPALFVHLSIPGAATDDPTAFSQTKRAAERAIVDSGLPYVILRPGFVWAPRAYGGSAMLRALAALPVDLPMSLAGRPLSVVAVEDIAETVAVLAQRWQQADARFAVTWELMQPRRCTMGEAVKRLRAWLGAGGASRLSLPMVLLKLGAWAGDACSWLGWRPPIRSTALAELMRGVTGDPHPWMEATGIAPRSLDNVLQAWPATVQEKWFARLYPLKAVIIAVLVFFWCASALIALTVAYPAAVAILTTHGYAAEPAHAITIVSSLMDFAVGLAIAFRRTSAYGLIAGIAVSLFYMLSAAVLTPDIWIEPLGALVKTFPAIVLMLVALAIADDR
jgi:uncharacterized protein YbjT (DUF2867 family)